MSVLLLFMFFDSVDDWANDKLFVVIVLLIGYPSFIILFVFVMVFAFVLVPVKNFY